MQFDLNLPEVYNAVDELVEKNLREGKADKVAFICEDRKLTYSQLSEGVNKFGNAVLSMDMRIGDRISIMLPDTEIWPQLFLGAIKAGAVPVCLNTLLRPKDYQYFLNDSRSRILVVDSSLLGNIDPIRENMKYVEHIIVVGGGGKASDLDYGKVVESQSTELEAAETCPDDSCYWLYSSGSTGNPKGTVHLQHDMHYCCKAFGENVINTQEDDVLFSAAKFFFAYGLGNSLYYPLSKGATAVLNPGRPLPETIFNLIEKHKPDVFFGVPTLFAQMLAYDGFKGDFGGMRFCVSAGEALPASILKNWKDKFGVYILDGIGSTEVNQTFISNTIDDVKPGSTGKIVPGYDARIVDENFQDIKEGEVGTLLIKGDSTAAHYWNKHKKTQKTMLGEWLNTDDKFFKDEEGYFFYVARTNDMMKVGGIWVSPIEVESCIISHDAVLECAVVEDRDDENLVKPHAYVILNKGYKASEELSKELKEYVKKNIAHYKYPRWITFVDDLPKTVTGKIKRFVLKKDGQDEAAA
jgi:benzoate-CoA ligase